MRARSIVAHHLSQRPDTACLEYDGASASFVLRCLAPGISIPKKHGGLRSQRPSQFSVLSQFVAAKPCWAKLLTGRVRGAERSTGTAGSESPGARTLAKLRLHTARLCLR